MSCQYAKSPGSDDPFDLLGDAYAIEILTTLAEKPATAVELCEQCQGSRTTVYRRLDRLDDAGFVRSQPRIRSDGNHCQVYHIVIDTLTISITDEGLEMSVQRR